VLATVFSIASRLIRVHVKRYIFILIRSFKRQYFYLILLSQVIFVWQCVDWSGLSLGDYKYPVWAELVGWGLCLASILFVPGYATYRLFSGDRSHPIKEVSLSHIPF